MNLNPFTCKINTNFKLLNDLKDSLKSFELGVTGSLSALKNKANELLDGLKDKFPTKKEFLSFAKDITGLDFNNPAALAEFKAKWGHIVDNIDELIANINNFDVCDYIDIKAKNNNGVPGEVIPQAPKTETPNEPPADCADSGAAPTETPFYISKYAEDKQIEVDQGKQYLKTWATILDTYNQKYIVETEEERQSNETKWAAIQQITNDDRALISDYRRFLLQKKYEQLKEKRFEPLSKAMSNYAEGLVMQNARKELFKYMTTSLQRKLTLLARERVEAISGNETIDRYLGGPAQIIATKLTRELICLDSNSWRFAAIPSISAETLYYSSGLFGSSLSGKTKDLEKNIEYLYEKFRDEVYSESTNDIQNPLYFYLGSIGTIYNL